MEQELAARLALRQGHYQAAERELAVLQPLIGKQPLWETDVLTLLVPVLTGQRRYATVRREQQLSRQRQHIALLQAQAQLRTVQYSRRLAQLGTAVLAGILLLTLFLVAGASRSTACASSARSGSATALPPTCTTRWTCFSPA